MPIKSDLQRIDRMTDEDIDYSDIPPLTDEQLSAMRPLRELLPEVARKKRANSTVKVLHNPKPSLRRISLRMPESMLSELKVLANKWDVSYQSLMKIFLAERIDQELRNTTLHNS